MDNRFIYEEDRDFFKYIRTRKRELRSYSLKIEFGKYGHIKFKDLKGNFGRFCSCSVMSFDTGRIYLNFWNHYEKITDKENIINDLLSLRRMYYSYCPQQTFSLLNTMPEAKKPSKYIRRQNESIPNTSR